MHEEGQRAHDRDDQHHGARASVLPLLGRCRPIATVKLVVMRTTVFSVPRPRVQVPDASWNASGKVPVDDVAEEEAGEEQHLGPQEQPHPEADRVVLLLDGVEVVRQVRLLAGLAVIVRASDDDMLHLLSRLLVRVGSSVKTGIVVEVLLRRRRGVIHS